uniref:Uncharacterized protein n=6 Tax=Aegilops tauschii subsp. strangulata TaxID=200361 RepID=A0A453K0W4_AEGTS
SSPNKKHPGPTAVVPELPDPQSLAAPRAAASPGHLRRTPRPPPPCRDATSAATPGPVATLPGPRRRAPRPRPPRRQTTSAVPPGLGSRAPRPPPPPPPRRLPGHLHRVAYLPRLRCQALPRRRDTPAGVPPRRAALADLPPCCASPARLALRCRPRSFTAATLVRSPLPINAVQ